MSIQPYGNRQLIYQADPVHVDTVKNLRTKLHGICREKLMNKHVVVRTVDGHEYEGIIVFVDGGQIYLSLAEDEELTRNDPFRFFPGPWGPYAPYNPAGAILPLVLYDLLAITLLAT